MEYTTKKEIIRTERRPDVYCESSLDYTLPDYDTDVRKILFTDAIVRPAGKFVGDGEVELSGIVVYTVVYTDNENKLKSVTFSSDYDLTAKCSTDNLSEVVCDTRVSNYAIRLLGPRRISARASIAESICASYTEELEIAGDAFLGDEHPEVSEEGIAYERIREISPLEREYAEPIAELDGAIADEVNVIFSDAEVIFDKAVVEDGGVTASGDILITAIIKSYEEPARLYTKVIPFEESLTCEGLSDGAVCLPTATVSSLASSINALDTGSEVVISLIVEFGAVCEYNERERIVSDAYLKSASVENSYGELSYGEVVYSGRERDSFSTELSRSEMLPDSMREIVFLKATPRLEHCECTATGVEIKGEIKYAGVSSELCDDGSVLYSPIKFSAPYSKNVNIDSQNAEDLRVGVKLYTNRTNATLDASSLYVSGDVECEITVVAPKKIKRLTSLSVGERDAEVHSSRITVYYPSEGDSLFSVAKRFRTSGEKIALDNSLVSSVSADGREEFSLTGVKKLIIS